MVIDIVKRPKMSKTSKIPVFHVFDIFGRFTISITIKFFIGFVDQSMRNILEKNRSQKD